MVKQAIYTDHEHMNPQIEPTSQEYEDTVDLQGMFLTFAENIQLLVLIPLLVGLLVYSGAYLVPQSYESSAVLKADAPIATYMTTANVLDAALLRLDDLDDIKDQDVEETRNKLRKKIATQVGRTDKLVTLTVTANSPAAAQGIAKAILESTFAEARPKPNELKKLQAEEAFLKQQIDELRVSSETLQKTILQASPNQELSRLIESRSTLSDSMIKIQTSLHMAQSKMEGLTSDALIQSPTLPIKPVAPRKILLAAASVLGSALLLLVYVFLRQSWKEVETSSRNQERLLKLRQRYGLEK